MLNVKRQLRNAMGWACRGSGVLARTESLCRDVLTVLCYHRVLPSDEKKQYFNPDLAVTPEALRAQCRVLSRHFDVMPLSRAVTVWQAGAARRPVAAMTFDDGYRDNFENALPVLDEFGVRGTFFVISDLVDSDNVPWYDALGEIVARADEITDYEEIVSSYMATASRSPRAVISAAKALPSTFRHEFVDTLQRSIDVSDACRPHRIMTTSQLQTLLRLGHEIGSHSRSHEILPLLSDEALRDEVLGSKCALESCIDSEVTSFCYPNGDVDARVAQAVQEAGYERAVTMAPGVNAIDQPIHQLNRWFIDEGRLAGMASPCSPTLVRMELSGLSQRVFHRQEG